MTYTHAVVKRRHLEAEEIEFLRWRAERWLMVRHMSEVLLHNPLFCLRHAHEVLRHMYRGSTLKSLVGLESERRTFARYCAIRKQEREYA
jgi:anaerobic magnesium-protoporphyrin IX monomethyl ester cyclase